MNTKKQLDDWLETQLAEAKEKAITEYRAKLSVLRGSCPHVSCRYVEDESPHNGDIDQYFECVACGWVKHV